MKRKLTLSVMMSCMLSLSSLFGQTCRLVVNENFNGYSGANTTYTEAMMKKDFANTSGPYKGLDGRTKVGNGVIQAFFKKGSLLGHETGFTWFQNLPDGGTDEAVMEYRVKFSKGYDWTKGGKLPGFAGGTAPRGCNEDQNVRDNGFSMRIMWHRDAQMITYPYWTQMNGRCGESWYWKNNNGTGSNIRMETDKWYTIRQHVKMNTPGQKNGIVEVWLDGKLVQRRTDLMLRKAGKNFKIDKAYWTTYVGGSTNDFRPSQDQYIWFDDFKVWVNCANPGNVNPNPNPVNQLPKVSLTSPLNNSSIKAGQKVTIDANASDADGSIKHVVFKINGQDLFVDPTSPYNILWTPAKAGTYTVTAVAVDNKGAVSESSVKVVVNTVQRDCAGVVNGSAKIDACGVCSGGTTGITPSSPKTWYADADGDGLGDASSSVQNCVKPAGYVATAGDQCPSDKNKTTPGDCGCGVAEGTCNQQAPVVQITNPKNGSVYVPGSSISVQVTASDRDGSIAKYQIYVNGTLVDTDYSNFTAHLISNMQVGNYIIKAVATDNHGNASEVSSTVIVKLEEQPSKETIIGASCASKNGSVAFELASEYRANANKFSWWISGASGETSSTASEPYKTTATFDQYFRGGEICVGINLNAAPYYISYCKVVDECAAQAAPPAPIDAAVSPNPIEGNFVVVETTDNAGSILELKVIDAAGLIKYQSSSVQSGDSIDLSSLSHGTYYLHIICENGVVVKKISVL